jgi:cytochrome c oxidase subunit 2
MFGRAKHLCMLLLGSLFLPLAYASDIAKTGRSAENMPVGVTPVSHAIYDIHMLMFWICVAIGVIVFSVLIFSLIKYRKSKGAVAATFHENLFAEITWTLIPLVILVAMAWPATYALIEVYDADEESPAAEMTVKITGYQWKWGYDYIGEGVSFISSLSTSQDKIRNRAAKDSNYLLEVDKHLVLPVETKISFLLTANDVIHSWWVPDLAVKKDAIPGFINDSWTYIEKPGIYRGQCAELCGKDHGFMPIVVEAVSKEDYQIWLTEQKAEAVALRELTSKTFSKDELMTRGGEVYNKSCAGCHMPNGEGIAGAFPALKGSAVALGDVNKHIEVVVSGVGGTAMQAFAGQLSDVDLAAVITYERNAWGNDTGDAVQPVAVYNFKKGE